MLEIEKKFLIKSLPADLEKFFHFEIVQGYLAILEDTEIRLRKKADRYLETIKIGEGEVRTEIEIELKKEQFDSLWPATEDKRLEKTRYKIPCDNLTIDLDLYHGKLEGFVSAEVEFEKEGDSKKFSPPEWFGEDVTFDKRYKNQSLVIYGLPK